MTKPQFDSVIVTGGLGNQLFQIIGAVSNYPEIKNGLYLTRKSESNTSPAVLDFNLDLITLELLHIKPSFYTHRLLNLSIRVSAIKKNDRIHNLLNGAINTLFSLTSFKKKCRIQNGLGFSNNEKKYKAPNCHIGYFQGIRGLENSHARKILSSLTLKNDVKGVIAFTENLARKERPLIVHYRLGDYLKEKKFGIPGPDYYEQSIDFLWSTDQYKRIWVFSNDINEAKKVFPSKYLNFVRWFEDTSISPAETLEQMRCGHGYVISNSTFAWWGAYLSKAKEPKVIAPSEWFKAKDDPSEMIPKKWLTFPGKYA